MFKSNPFVFALLLFISACSQKKPVSYEEYMGWMGIPENGMVKSHSVNGLEIKVKFLPAEYLAYQELKNEKIILPAKRDSLLAFYSRSLTFLMVIGPDEAKKTEGDVMMKGVKSYEEFAQKAMTMNFDMSQYVTLKTKEGEFKPVLSNMENVYGLSKSRNILFVFAPIELKDTAFLHSNEYDFVYEDQLFQIGINHFVFKKGDIDNRPLLAL